MTKWRIMVLVLACVLIAGACGDDSDGADTTAASGATETTTAGDEPATTAAADTTMADDGELIPIDYATSFGLFGRDAYAYVALDKGYFEEAGFDVNVVPGNGSVQNAQLVAAGQLDFAPADFSALVLLRANEDVPVRGVSTVHQEGLSAIMAKGDGPIQTPQDLPGHSIADVAGSVVVELFPFYAERVGIDPESVEFVASEPQQLPGLLASDQVDAVNQFVVGQPLFESVTEGPINVFPYAEFFPELIGIVIVASDDTISDDPEMVEAFVGALNRGLEDAVNDPEEAGQILVSYQPDANADVAAAELTLMREYVITDYTEANGVGSVDPERVQASIDLIADAFELGDALTVEGLYVSATG